jgi:hypothetical protein
VARPSLPAVDLARTAQGLTGTVTNTTPDELRDAVVLFAGRAIHLGTLPLGRSVDVGSRPSQPLAEYARGCVPNDLRERERYYGYYPWGRELHREEAEAAARWVSVFALQDEAGVFRRWLALKGEESADQGGGGEVLPSVVFDLTRQLELTGVEGRTEAVLLYSVDRSFLGVLLSERQPRSWDRSLVRLRVPVAKASE